MMGENGKGKTAKKRKKREMGLERPQLTRNKHTKRKHRERNLKLKKIHTTYVDDQVYQAEQGEKRQ